ncbi:MAG: hypothetical protein KatS3mg105_1224 [Gemmatales bacterium]|nr:MAG: hypothetical protein KatS3mg105_1224 [Gemmatales bacterium]
MDIPGYELLEKIGEGGRGEVYRARQLATDRPVAVKFLNPFANSDLPVPRGGFLREPQLLGSLSHPNVIEIYDAGEIAGRFYMVMEYVPGSNLRQRMKPGEPWKPLQAAPILNSIARALSYIHSRDILHLDLKPENVLCGEWGTIKITDFGLALSRVDAWTLSRLGVVEGSLDYCSPEQRHGLPIDQRSDLFSLATMTYELLAGKLPGRLFVPCTRFNPELSEEVDRVLEHGLKRDPDERYGAVEEFRRDLMRALQFHL